MEETSIAISIVIILAAVVAAAATALSCPRRVFQVVPVMQYPHAQYYGQVCRERTRK